MVWVADLVAVGSPLELQLLGSSPNSFLVIARRGEQGCVTCTCCSICPTSVPCHATPRHATPGCRRSKDSRDSHDADVDPALSSI